MQHTVDSVFTSINLGFQPAAEVISTLPAAIPWALTVIPCAGSIYNLG